MTKKKNGLFSKIKSKFSKNDDVDDSLETYEDEYEDEEYEDEDDDEEDEDEYEDEYEDEDDSYEDDDSEDEDDEDDDDIIDEESKPSLIAKIKNKLSSSNEDEDEDEDEDEEDDEEDDEDEDKDEDQESDLNEEEWANKTIELEVDEATKPSLIAKIKSKFSKSSDEDDDEYEDEDELPSLPPTEQKKPVMQALVDKLNVRKEPAVHVDSPSNSTHKTPISTQNLIPRLLGNKEIIHKGFILTLSFTCFYSAGKFAGIYLGKEKKSKKSFKTGNFYAKSYSPRKDISDIKYNNIFNAKENEADKVIVKKKKKKEPEIKVCFDAKKKSSLSLKLVNTIVLMDSVKSVASVSRRGKTLNFREGDKIGREAEIGKITRQRVILKNLRNGRCEYIEGKKQRSSIRKKLNIVSKEKGKKLLKKGISSTGNTFKIKKSLRDSLLSNIGEVLTQAKAIQIKNPDGTLSFKMMEIVPGSIYTQLNMKNGDIITGVNGKKIRSVNDMMNLFGKIKDFDEYEISVKRDGTEQTFNYNFTQ